MYDLGFGQNGLLSLALAAVALLVGLWVWFLVNRASVRANEQIRLLQEIAEQQRQQTALLKRLAHSARADGGDADDDDLSPALDFKGLSPNVEHLAPAGAAPPGRFSKIPCPDTVFPGMPPGGWPDRRHGSPTDAHQDRENRATRPRCDCFSTLLRRSGAAAR